MTDIATLLKVVREGLDSFETLRADGEITEGLDALGDACDNVQALFKLAEKEELNNGPQH